MMVDGGWRMADDNYDDDEEMEEIQNLRIAISSDLL